MISEKEVLELYSYYYDEIKRLGARNIASKVKFDDLNLPKGKVRAAYMQMKEIGFKGTIVDYLCWVSSNIVLYFLCLDIGYEDYAIRNIKRVLKRHRQESRNFFRYLTSKEEDALQLIEQWGFEDKQKIVRLLAKFIGDEIITKGKILQ